MRYLVKAGGPGCLKQGLHHDRKTGTGPVSYTHLDVYKRQIIHDIHGRSLKKYLQIIEGLLCIFLFTIFLSAFMIDPTQLYTGIGGMKCGTGKDRLEESVC